MEEEVNLKKLMTNKNNINQIKFQIKNYVVDLYAY